MSTRQGIALSDAGRLNSVSRRIVIITAAASVAAAAIAVLQVWPAWAIVTAGLAPWVPLLALEIGWTRSHYGWLALFSVLVLTQSGHVVEHLVQMVQLHLLHRPPPQARGVFGALDIEWVHFGWNTWVFISVLLLLGRFSRNPWLWATAALATWHQAEHTYIITRYIQTGLPGDPGLAAMGGLIGSGLPIKRPDLHFYYNLIETTPLVVGFVYQLHRTYDSWLARAFPRLGADALARTTALSRTRRLARGETLAEEDDLTRTCFIVTRGEVEVLRGRRARKPLTKLGPGQAFGEVGRIRKVPRGATVRARTTVDLLEISGSELRGIIDGAGRDRAPSNAVRTRT